MGVLSCSKRFCYNIMCDTYINGVGYVCMDCQDEFKNYLKKFSLNPQTTYEIIEELKRFMEEPTGKFIQDNTTSVDKFFNNNTRND